jgi:hypothetical protein
VNRTAIVIGACLLVLAVAAVALLARPFEVDVRTDEVGAVNVLDIYPGEGGIAAAEAAVEDRGGRVLEILEVGELREEPGLRAVFDVEDRDGLAEVGSELEREGWVVRAALVDRVHDNDRAG